VTKVQQIEHDCEMMVEWQESITITLDWTEQCFTSPPTQYRLYGTRLRSQDQCL